MSTPLTPPSLLISRALQRRLVQLGPEVAFTRTVSFDEKSTLEASLPYIRRSVGIEAVDIVLVSDAKPEGPAFSQLIVDAAEPGAPGILLYNTEA